MSDVVNTLWLKTNYLVKMTNNTGAVMASLIPFAGDSVSIQVYSSLMRTDGGRSGTN